MKTLFTSILLSISFVSNLQASTFKTQQWHTKNGAKVVFYQAMEVPMLDISIAFAAGSAYDGKQFGLSALTSDLLAQGNAGMDATQIAERIADTGAQFNNEISRDMAVLSLKTLTNEEALKRAIDTFELIVSKPDFPQDAFERKKSAVNVYRANARIS